MINPLWGYGADLQDMVYVLNRWLMCGAVPPIAGICMSGKQEMEVGLGLLIIISSNLCGEYVLSVATTLGSDSCEE